MYGLKYFFAEEFFNLAENSYHKHSHPLLKYQVKKDFVQLLKLLKNYHFETYRHSINVARLSFLISQELGISTDEIIATTIGGLLHDIGKIKINPLLLCKSAKLTQSEWDLIKKHPHFGVHILSAFSWGNKISPIISYHHERIDGNGYYGLKGDNIPLGSRIISIADAYEAMVSPRPYQKSLSLSESWQEIKNNSGSQFDPKLVQILIKITSKYHFIIS
ncbi:MAG: HD-GYP domain-containing protein [Dehalobacterium sp.]